MKLDKCIKGLTKALDNLSKLIETNDNRLADNQSIIRSFEQENVTLVAENTKASKIKANLNKLLEV